ncbi:MAG: hypothetical protein Q7V57_09505 [Actinomycetota bacterium]|nr:hypothetical protein [Actinomycetota bacterium]
MNDLLTNILTFAVLGFMGFRLVTGVQHSRTADGRSLVQRVWRNAGWRHVWPVPLLLAAVIATATVIMSVPGLDWGWWSAIGGDGNPVFGSSTATTGTVWEWLIPLAFMALLLPALPLFAYAEERLFRTGAEVWSHRRRALKVVQFGLVHALIGIPIGAALALSLGGAYFMWAYLRRFAIARDRTEATVESATAHTVYNFVIVVVVIVAVLADALV